MAGGSDEERLEGVQGVAAMRCELLEFLEYFSCQRPTSAGADTRPLTSEVWSWPVSVPIDRAQERHGHLAPPGAFAPAQAP